MEELRNYVTFFMPFSFDDESSVFLGENKAWDLYSKNKVQTSKYFFKFISDKLDPAKGEECQCCRYVLNEASDEYQKLIKDKTFSITKTQFFDKFEFVIENFDLFLFSTGIGLIGMRVSFSETIPKVVSSASYLIKKVAKVKFLDADKNEYIPLEMVKSLLSRTISYNVEFYQFANEGQERANTFSYIECETDENYEEDVFMLSHNYDLGFTYNPEIDRGDWLYRAASDVAWGITDEALSCRVFVNETNASFRQGTFRKNVLDMYVTMYALLLHQKYFLYDFLTRVGVESNSNDLKTLSDFKVDLAKFHNNFLFDVITEVPQYQRLYDRIVKIFRIKDLYEDAEKPINRLATLQKEHDEEEDNAHDKAVNRILSLLAVLGVISALCDWIQVKESFDGVWNVLSFNGLSTIAFGVILIGVLIYVVYTEFKRKKK